MQPIFYKLDFFLSITKYKILGGLSAAPKNCSQNEPFWHDHDQHTIPDGGFPTNVLGICDTKIVRTGEGKRDFGFGATSTCFNFTMQIRYFHIRISPQSLVRPRTNREMVKKANEKFDFFFPRDVHVRARCYMWNFGGLLA